MENEKRRATDVFAAIPGIILSLFIYIGIVILFTFDPANSASSDLPRMLVSILGVSLVSSMVATTIVFLHL